MVASASGGEKTSGAEGSAGGRVAASKDDDRTEETDRVKIIVPVCQLGEP